MIKIPAKLQLGPLCSCVLLLLASSNSIKLQAQTDSHLESQAQSLVESFARQLKPALQKALGDGGPVHAIHVCSQEAPRIAESLGQESGWQVKRVSLKARNVATAIPDDWEREQLLGFEQGQKRGEKPHELRAAAKIDGEYRYMQAQLVEPLCLVCHGEAIADDVKQALASIYPDDIATGYQLGEVRGAISLSKVLEP